MIFYFRNKNYTDLTFKYLEVFYMNLYGNYKSRLGYQTGENQIDSYGVDHSGFSTRDELEYQFARRERENK